MKPYWSWFSASAQRERWEKTRTKGKKHFVLRRGVLAYGIPMFIVMTISQLIQRRSYSHSWRDYAVTILINFVVWPLGGYFWGIWTWSSLNDKFPNPTRTGN